MGVCNVSAIVRLKDGMRKRSGLGWRAWREKGGGEREKGGGRGVEEEREKGDGSAGSQRQEREWPGGYHRNCPGARITPKSPGLLEIQS